MGCSRIPLAADIVAGLEDRDVKPCLDRILRGDQPSGPRADDRYPCSRGQHAARIPPPITVIE
jgi:hypothetical protein